MKIAIDISPLSSGHKVRGVGFYLENLKKSLLENFPDNEYLFFNDLTEVPDDFDLIHFPYFDPFFLTLPSKKKQKIVVTIHDLTPIVFKDHFPAGIKGDFRWIIQKRRLKNVDALITDSKSSKGDIERLTHVDGSKISVIYLAASDNFKKIKTDKKPEIFKKNKIPKNFALYVGDATWNKNLVRIIESFDAVGIPLVMVGKAIVNKNVDLRNTWNKDLIAVQNMTENSNKFIKLGFVSNEDLNFLYNSAQCLLMPSLYEGFGLPVIEAMQAGCPVITSKEGSLPEVGGDAVYYVDSHNFHSIAEGIIKVINDPNLQKELSKKGLERANNFSWKETAKQTMEVYRSICQT